VSPSDHSARTIRGCTDRRIPRPSPRPQASGKNPAVLRRSADQEGVPEGIVTKTTEGTVNNETTAVLSIAAEQFLTGRYASARNVFAALARGEDPRAASHVVCIRNGRMFDVRLPSVEIGNAPPFVAALLRAEHVIGLEEQLDIAPPPPGEHPLTASAQDIGVRLWAHEAWIEQRSAVRVSDRYISFPRSVRWNEPNLSPPERDRFVFDYEAAFSPLHFNDEQATVILEHKGCAVHAIDLDKALDRWLAEHDLGFSGPTLADGFGELN
jgi:hypothetical protein